MPTQRQNEKVVAFVLYPGLTAFDLSGPLQVMSELATIRPEIRPVVVGERIESMDTDASVQIVPEQTFEEVPHPHVLVVPGGTRPTLKAMSAPAIRNYVRTAAETADAVASVCTGALILASVGLLQGRNATTHWATSAILESLGARYHRKRWVEDGRFITSAGVSAGIDMGLQLAARLTDEPTAREVQRALDYDPQPPFGGLDYGEIGFALRTRRAAASLAAPLLAARSKRLTEQERTTSRTGKR